MLGLWEVLLRLLFSYYHVSLWNRLVYLLPETPSRRVLATMLRMLVAISAFSTTLAMPNYSCKIYLATTPISTQNVYLAITPPANQSAVTAFITSYTSQTSKNFMISDTNGSPQTIDVNDRYQIYTQLCTPSTFENGTDVEFVVHGCVNHCGGGLKEQNIYLTIKSLSRVGFDHTYWNFGGKGSENNYVESAIAAGRSVLIYDALGQFNCFITINIYTPIYFFSFMHRCWPFVNARWHHNSTEICRYRDCRGTRARIKNRLGWPSVWQSCRHWSWLWQVWILCDKMFWPFISVPFFLFP